MADKDLRENMKEEDFKSKSRGYDKAPAMRKVDKPSKKMAFSSENLQDGEKPGGKGAGANKRSGGRTAKPEPVESPYIESVVRISRVAKATKGGTKLSFSALVVVGDGKGSVGYALGKAGAVAEAIRKAMGTAKKRMIEVPCKGSTIPHEIIGQWCSSRVLLKPAGEGTGVIASGAVRAVCDGAGIKNILTKGHRSRNPLNVVKATFNGLSRLKKVSVRDTVKQAN